MAEEVLKRDQNHVVVLGAVTDDSNQDITMLRVDPTTKRLLVSATGGGGGTPGGPDTAVQFNDGGAFGGGSDFTWNKISKILTFINEGSTVTIQGGTATSSNTDGTGFTIQGGGGNGAADGGDFILSGGLGGSTSGTGGDFIIRGGSAIAGNSNGGSLIFAYGSKFGSGTNGQIMFQNPSTGINTILNIDSVATSSKTFTFPNSSGTFALTNNKLSVFAATTSAELAGVISDETGSGLLVFATNPTLSGATFADATNIVLNTGTGTKIGTATTQKLAFYNSTPIVQPTGDIATALQNLGLVSSATYAAATTITVANEATDTTCFPLFVTAATGNLGPKSNANLTYNSNTGDFSIGTTAALTAGTIELGAASDTTLSRASAGQVNIEGVQVSTASNTITLSNKTLTAPKFANAGFIADANGNEEIIFTTTASAVNEITIANAATGGNPTISATGGDTDISLSLSPKGAGIVAATTQVQVTGTTDFNTAFKAVTTTSGALTGGPIVQLYFNKTTQAVNDSIGAVGWYGNDSTTSQVFYGDLNIYASNVTHATRASMLQLRLVSGGSTFTAMTVTDAGNVKLGGTANRGTTEGTNQLVLFNGTAPVGTLTNGVSFYAASGEARVMDAAGNSTLLSPHDDNNEWVFYSKNTKTGKVLKINMERMMKFLNEHFETDFVEEYVEDPEVDGRTEYLSTLEDEAEEVISSVRK